MFQPHLGQHLLYSLHPIDGNPVLMVRLAVYLDTGMEGTRLNQRRSGLCWHCEPYLVIHFIYCPRCGGGSWRGPWRGCSMRRRPVRRREGRSSAASKSAPSLSQPLHYCGLLPVPSHCRPRVYCTTVLMQVTSPASSCSSMICPQVTCKVGVTRTAGTAIT